MMTSPSSEVYPRIGFLLLILMVLSAGGCTAGPDFSSPGVPSAKNYTAEPVNMRVAADTSRDRQQVNLGSRLQTDWWTLLQSRDLDQTVVLALSNNKTLDIARANLAKASEAVKGAQGSLYPQIDVSGQLGRQQYGAAFMGPLVSGFPPYSWYSGGMSVTYDLDIFGGDRRRIELASADSEVQQENLNSAMLSVAGNVVIDVLQLGSIHDQIAVVEKVVSSDEQTLQLVRSANVNGAATNIDVATAQSQLDRDRALLPPQRQLLAVAQDSLAALVGRSPAVWTAPETSLGTIRLPRNIPLVVPSELVRTRPDIRAAEAQLHAASAAVGVATADLYPRINLSAAISEQGLLGGPAGAAWSLLGGLTAPIFHGGALAASRHAAEDTYQAAFASYQQTVLTSFQQVADSLHGLGNAADAVTTERRALNSANEALRLTRIGYSTGSTTFTQVLDAQRLQQLAELSLVQAQTDRFIQTVNLFLAVGGGVAARVRQPAPQK